MALTESYLITTKNLQSVINSVVSAKAPERFNNKFLESLEFKSTNDRLYVGLFKSLGLIDESGMPLQRYYQFIDQSETNRVLAQGILEAYEDLFNLRKDAQNLTAAEVKNKLKTITQGQKSDAVLDNMTRTFKALCDIADWTTIKEDKTVNQNSHEKAEDIFQNAVKKVPDVEEQKQTASSFQLKYDIHIHLPETTNMAVYDAIFKSLKNHLV
jgi:hypothetical protein